MVFERSDTKQVSSSGRGADTTRRGMSCQEPYSVDTPSSFVSRPTSALQPYRIPGAIPIKPLPAVFRLQNLDTVKAAAELGMTQLNPAVIRSFL